MEADHEQHGMVYANSVGAGGDLDDESEPSIFVGCLRQADAN